MYLSIKTRGPEIEKAMRRVIRKVSEGGMKMGCMLLSQKIEKNNCKMNRIQSF